MHPSALVNVSVRIMVITAGSPRPHSFRVNVRIRIRTLCTLCTRRQERSRELRPPKLIDFVRLPAAARRSAVRPRGGVSGRQMGWVCVAACVRVS